MCNARFPATNGKIATWDNPFKHPVDKQQIADQKFCSDSVGTRLNRVRIEIVGCYFGLSRALAQDKLIPEKYDQGI